MHTFRVWAPLPKKVEVQVGKKRFPMNRDENGWWTAEVNLVGTPRCGVQTAQRAVPIDYGFILDGKGPFPDPRSPWQPDGVHGLSRLVDHNDFKWTDKHFQALPLASAIIYELHVGTFTSEGTFESAIKKLEHLVKLGVTHVEMMPVAEFSGDHNWGYDGVDLFAPHHAYGGLLGLKKIVNACHARGFAVILDVVYNHLGPAGNFLGKFAPYFTQRYAPVWGEAINFDGADSDEVRRFFCDNALMWLRDYHFDGLRLDAVHAIFDSSAIHILEELKIEVEKLSAQLGRHFVLIPESDLNDPRLLWSREHGGYQLDAQWSDDFHHALHTVLTGEKNGYYADFGSLADLAKTFKDVFVYDGKFSKYRRCSHGRPAGNLNGSRFLGYLQNHDQIGNRAQGERSSHLMSLGKLKIGAAIVLTSPFVPMLFQGEEWGASTPFQFFTDHREPKLAKAIGIGRCKEFVAFGWKPEEIPDPQSRGTFLRSKLNWREILRAPHAELLAWHRKLIQLRHSTTLLTDGRLDCIQTRFDELNRWLTISRGSICIVCNINSHSQHVPLPAGKHRLLLASEPQIKMAEGHANLPPESVAIFATRD
ncbi:MAG TPA: malto-oligosyltrehalose trehalohydrolase [Methylomirabilota bacterium]|nr:malto-oligosyltrehalose trehalohydrolase [Methylomirabilota bacterium]